MTQAAENIHIIATGGTIDCEFSPKEYQPIPRDKTVIPDFIRNYIKPHFDVEASTVMMIDSLLMTDEMREDIVAEVQASDAQRILVTHGTDGMIRTAKRLTDLQLDKTIVLVGSMIPLIGFTPSDGGFNLGFAIANLLHLDSGVYICMNGQVFTADNVTKNLDKSRFEFDD